MRIHGKRLGSIVKARGATPEQLAAAIERVGLKGDRAVSAVKNWMRGSDHPRCRAADVKKLAEALGCSAADIAQFECIIWNHRGSPRKAKLLTDLVKGRSVDDALNQLSFTPKRAAVNVKKALSAAIADAEQHGADVGRLVVSTALTQKGLYMKRFHQKDRGRAHPILKRSAHITLCLVEQN